MDPRLQGAGGSRRHREHGERPDEGKQDDCGDPGHARLPHRQHEDDPEHRGAGDHRERVGAHQAALGRAQARPASTSDRATPSMALDAVALDVAVSGVAQVRLGCTTACS